jgi:hypothetical protein
MKHHKSILAVLLLLASAVGCDSSKTETGYTPHRLGMGNSAIRSLYAPEFSPEAKAETERKQESQVRRPQY